uniref:Secreted protein n=1 Tax=Anopheles darlingi TaxID=43151 RepID=A0A2M4D739_ANODA
MFRTVVGMVPMVMMMLLVLLACVTRIVPTTTTAVVVAAVGRMCRHRRAYVVLEGGGRCRCRCGCGRLTDLGHGALVARCTHLVLLLHVPHARSMPKKVANESCSHILDPYNIFLLQCAHQKSCFRRQKAQRLQVCGGGRQAKAALQRTMQRTEQHTQHKHGTRFVSHKPWAKSRVRAFLIRSFLAQLVYHFISAVVEFVEVIPLMNIHAASGVAAYAVQSRVQIMFRKSVTVNAFVFAAAAAVLLLLLLLFGHRESRKVRFTSRKLLDGTCATRRRRRRGRPACSRLVLVLCLCWQHQWAKLIQFLLFRNER